ncbi:MAG: hypothetical protein JNM68_10745 [Dinghuibacter sp.]|nr:hypothetical protein [Dinghuibacter sp.]
MSTPRHYTIAKWLMGISACAILVFGLMSFRNNGNNNNQCDTGYAQQVNDTVPDKLSEKTTGEINKAMRELGQALGQVGRELKKIEWERIGKEVEISLKEVNIEKIMAEARQAIERADIPKISAELEREMKNKDNKQLEAEIENSIKQGLKEFEGINWSEMEKALKDAEIEVKDFDKEKFKAEMEKLKPVLKEKMQELKKELKKLEKENKKSGYACKKKCSSAGEEDFIPYVPVEPMI